MVLGTSGEPASAAFRIESSASAPRSTAALGSNTFLDCGSMPSASMLSAVICVAEPSPWQ